MACIGLERIHLPDSARLEASLESTSVAMLLSRETWWNSRP
jgi:hypothetical protein